MTSLLDYDPKVIEMKKKTLELREYVALIRIGKTSADSLRVEESEDFMTQDIIRRFSMSVLTDKIAEDKYTKHYSYSVYPSPWQHFKDLYMPEWFKKKYPVVMDEKHGEVTVRLTRLAKYPKANVAIQNNQRLYEVLLGGFESIEDIVE